MIEGIRLRTLAVGEHACLTSKKSLVRKAHKKIHERKTLRKSKKKLNKGKNKSLWPEIEIKKQCLLWRRTRDKAFLKNKPRPRPKNGPPLLSDGFPKSFA
jgi:hypothetical protein